MCPQTFGFHVACQYYMR